jgi:hypothetical protein
VFENSWIFRWILSRASGFINLLSFQQPFAIRSSYELSSIFAGKEFRLRQRAIGERKGDIPLLVNHFLEKMNRIEGKLIKGFEGNALEAMRACGWAGNVWELENAVERAYILCPALP